MWFIIPSPAGGVAQGVAAGGGWMQPALQVGGAPAEAASPAEELGFAGIRTAPELHVAGGSSAPAEAPVIGPAAQAEANRILHILCPKGHELETPADMIGQDAMCPHCQLQFRLRFEDSLEYKEERRKERERREMAFGRRALQWAIVAAVLVLLGLSLLFIMGRPG
jgi:hypothetical protein